ncbi:ADP-ribosylation factor-like protein 2-binding protein [Ciona intestinalis]
MAMWGSEMEGVVCGSEDEQRFDEIIGSIQDVLISDEFLTLQQDFMDKYYHVFEDTEENKFIYTDIFQEYNSIFEKYLEMRLTNKLPWFSMEKFAASLTAHKHEICDEIFETLTSFTDFMTFKEMFVDYRAEKDGRNDDLMQGLVVQSLVPTTISVALSST